MSKAGLTATLRLLAKQKLRLAFALSLLSLTVASGVTFGSWSITGTGNGYSKAVTAQALTTASVATTGQLYPGGTGDLKINVTNPNLFAVTITSVAGNGTITSDQGASCNAATGVTFTNTTGLSQAVGAGATVTFTLTNKVSMSNSSDNACQGAVFTVPISISATS